MRNSLLFGLLILAAAGPAAAPADKAADGTDIPQPTFMERRFDAAIPLIHSALGGLPGDLSPKVFSAKTSADVLARMRVKSLGCAWFALKVTDADIAGFDLSEGRVCRVVLGYRSLSPARRLAIGSQTADVADKVLVTFDPKEAPVAAAATRVILEIKPTELYIANHPDLTKPTVEAIRAEHYIDGMTEEQALLVNDGPGVYAIVLTPLLHSGGFAATGGLLSAPSGGGEWITKSLNVRGKSRDAVIAAAKERDWAASKIRLLPKGAEAEVKEIPDR